MNVMINPGYDYLRDWIEAIPDSFDREGDVIYRARNVIKVFSPGNGLVVNVKKFRRPHFFNRIVYTFFKKSKACRSYYYTLRISEKGFETAGPVAFIEVHKGGLLSDSYYVSLQCRDVREIREYYSGPLAGNERLMDAFARYSAALHDAGVYHLDYSPGNILFREDPASGEYHFIPVDVNRMKFMPVSPDRGCRNFARLFADDEIYKHIGAVYSQSRKEIFGKEEAVRLILKYKNRFLKKKARKEKLKRLFRRGASIRDGE
jgi:serine/threonine protein kinase